MGDWCCRMGAGRGGWWPERGTLKTQGAARLLPRLRVARCSDLHRTPDSEQLCSGTILSLQLTYRRHVENFRGTLREQARGRWRLRRRHACLAWRDRCFCSDRHRLFHCGAARSGASRPTRNSGRVLAGRGHRHRCLDCPWAKRTLAGGYRHRNCHRDIQALDYGKPPARRHIRPRLRGSDPPHGLVDRALVSVAASDWKTCRRYWASC